MGCVSVIAVCIMVFSNITALSISIELFKILILGIKLLVIFWNLIQFNLNVFILGIGDRGGGICRVSIFTGRWSESSS